MKMRTNRQLKALETKNRLIDAALRTFSRKGFSQSTTKDIAKEAGVTDGLIYHYFQSKEDLLWAILDKYTLLHSLQEVLNKMDNQASLEHNLTVYFHSLFRSLHEQQDLIVMCFGEAQHNSDVRKRLEGVIRQGVELLHAYLAPRVRVATHDLLIAIRNIQTAMVLYFLMTDRFADNETDRNKYIETSVRQFLKVLQ
ncbi:TetR/AcrR family transcriptional regulator [Aneurinibacillus thermoaerophilus]|uniref:DNA-binding transcriptional regulator, AcrR family n=1 Tax=Aneurinibacillus thermoaerophilus TaxID=143495 RepID=A0A1G7Y1V3_ANETH|nr:TetR/AcrR family transcriptional regulator [Aneurinibacillus thermoaerophilus]MED0675906.1 TetR/AcrR family transcriptional regulator [Aneurinibacillus thermoaerophilus]MED0677819.1 TetR/AcrR family transcriptional regulator [Aneurinibacillus thermoaerophilus]MED0737568.1 TetR/AcrR family transcriptional regulator [Aneurinibacillus thermoaerophilus]MED0758139.1 TetR/AcrR family transcriptional regulator [Aneurinibacillus thermoaerophilus]MED0761293.1 TetR/AcrR family transcriptional regulat